MKKFFAMLLALTMALSLAACGGNDAAETPADETTDAPAEETGLDTVTGGKLTLATCPDYAPFGFYAIGEDGSAELVGYDIAVAQYVADYLGLELEIITMDFDGILSEVAAGSVDMGMACPSPTPERAEVMNFSDFYYEVESEDNAQIVFTTQANKDKWASLEDLNDPNVTVGVQLGSLQAELAEANTPDADTVMLAKVTDIISEVLGGKLDAGYSERTAIESYQANYPDLYIALDVPSAAPKGSSIGMTLGDDALLAGVNEAIAAAKADGSLDTFMAEAKELAKGNIYEGLME